MDLPDIHLRVLYDFEYTTRDGINVKIQEGEKLYLIKRTNQDWWQVIRNSGRPFYVPTTYVEEIPRTNSWSGGEVQKQKIPVQENYRSRSCSVESQQTHENHKPKPVVPKRTVFDTTAKRNNFCDPSSPVKPTRLERDEDDDGSVYVNLGNKSSFDRVAKPSNALERSHSSIVNNVDRLIENISNNLMSVDDEYTNGYSHVSIRKCNLSRKEYEGQLRNLSNSLEELTQQIELKAQSIGSKTNENLLPKSLTEYKPVRPRPQESSSFKHFPDLIKKYEDKSRLQYSGSFKTKHEYEKIAKNQVLLSTTKEEDMITETNNRRDKLNDDNNNLNKNKKINDSVIKDSPSIVNNEQDNNEVSGKNLTAGTNSFASEQEDKVSPLKTSFDSSAEDLDKNCSYANSKLTLSDKGSTDSLLEMETHNSIQDESLCTTDSLLQTSDTSEECLPSLQRDELSPEKFKQRKKAALKRNNRVEYRLRYPIRVGSPPVPDEHQQVTRELFGGWCEYSYADGRIFFYNAKTGEKSWKPPRRRCNTDERCGKVNGSASNLYSGSSSPFTEADENAACIEQSGIAVPEGWRLELDAENGCPCYISIITGAKWFSSNDDEGRVYYFAENSSESSWTLPANITNPSIGVSDEHGPSLTDEHVYSNLPAGSRSTIISKENSLMEGSASSLNNRIAKSKSMILVENKPEEPPALFALKHWPQLEDGRMNVLMEGVLNKTKMTENGKRVRKNWSTSHVVLTELFLVFYKDAKQKACSRPEMSVDLNGALIDRGDKFSSRKNVYMISTVLGFQVLIQTDCAQTAEDWLMAIQKAITNLPSGFDSCPRLARGPVETEDVVPEVETNKKSYKVTRSKSVKAKNKDGSMEDLAVTSAERQTKIRARLKKFFNRRPTMELLVKKGIWKDEPAFGCFLADVVTSDSPKVPVFVRRCIECIERSEENMKTDGLYRASGNLSQVQKIRLQVDQNNLSVIDEEEDVHVLTGALKLFFRELKEPLIPYDLFDKAISASHNSNKKEKISQFREITKALPTANYDTLKFLLQHLLKVKKYKDFNRMHIPNLAIVFGPTLMWPKLQSNNMALDLMQQNLVIECLLVDYENIFR